MRITWKSKRAISPILGTLLLIVIAVAAAIATYAWVLTFTSSQTGTSGEFPTITNVDWSSTSEIVVDLMNSGTADAKIVTVYLGTSPTERLEQTSVSYDPTTQIVGKDGGTLRITITCSWQSGVRYYFRFVTESGNHLDYNVLTPSATQISWWNTNYSYRKQINVTNNAEDWLGGWDQRVRIAIDSGDIDGALTDFPLMLYLSSSSGENGEDVSFVFDELQSDANRKKIAVTTGDSVTQCYVEIERWDDANEQAWLWVKVPSVSNTTDTELYLYYDADHTDNTAYVGDPGSRPEVWDSDYVAVWHLQETVGGTDAFKDSTANGNNGTDYNSPTLGEAGKIGYAIHFNDTLQQWIQVPDSVSLGSPSDKLTLSAWVYLTADQSDDAGVIIQEENGDPQYNMHLGVQDEDQANFRVWKGSGSSSYTTGTTVMAQDTWYYIYGIYDGSTSRVFVNAVQEKSVAYTGDIASTTQPALIGRRAIGDNRFFTGRIDEVRIAYTARADEWMKASYESERDHLLDFASEESGSEDGSTLGSGYSVSLTLNTTSLVSAGKMLSSGNDLRIVYGDGATGTELDRHLVNMDTAATQVWFKTQADIAGSGFDDDYYIYYGNPSAGSPPADNDNVYVFYDDFESGDLSNWAVQSGTWSAATDQKVSGSYSMKVTTGSDSWIKPTASISEVDVLLESYWRSASGSLEFSQALRVQSGSSMNWFETDVEGSSGWDIAKMVSDSWLEIVANGGSYSADTWYNVTFIVKDGTLAKVLVNDTQVTPASGWADIGTDFTTAGTIAFRANSVGTGAWVDDAKVRRYVDPEPSTSLGSEEST